MEGQKGVGESPRGGGGGSRGVKTGSVGEMGDD